MGNVLITVSRWALDTDLLDAMASLARQDEFRRLATIIGPSRPVVLQEGDHVDVETPAMPAAVAVRLLRHAVAARITGTAIYQSAEDLPALEAAAGDAFELTLGPECFEEATP